MANTSFTDPEPTSCLINAIRLRRQDMHTRQGFRLLKNAVPYPMTSPAALMLALVLPATGSPSDSMPQPSVELPAPLARVLRDYEQAWQKKDATALAGLFASDGYVLPNGRPPVHGRAAIEKHYDSAGGPLALRAFAYASEGSVGYIIGGYARDRGQPDIGKFTLTLRKNKAGRWMIVSDMDNGNRRPKR